MNELLWTAGGAGFIFAMTCLGSAMVFLFRRPPSGKTQNLFLGFAAGIMISASVWSLLIPAMEASEEGGRANWLPAAAGFTLGVLFLLAMDWLIPHLHPGVNRMEGLSSSAKRTTLLVFAVTLHNIPEGMAVGLSFALAAQHGGDPALLASAMALAIGIGIQNFPEGAAISLPLRQEGFGVGKAFLLGCLSGAVEPASSLLVVLAAGLIAPFMPLLLAFAAGAMMYVVVEELIPEAHLGDHSNAGTLSVMGGFLLMMILDVALG
ncbi:MAG: ZIP family metal transporter [Planctomycetota bacterium]|nr:ZIP family metal transporter [Planctomycetota bacterium]